jgi:hypothetical protein
MKLLLVLASDKNYELISTYVKPLGFEIIRYKHVLKAMDNIDEIDPTGIIVSASDFPRHWKTIVQFVRSERPKETTPIIILRGDNFLLDDTTKAFYIGVSGIVSENLSESMEIDRLQSILSRYVPVEEKRKAKRYKLGKDEHMEFMFTHPENGRIITGKIKDISQTGLSFHLDKSNLLKDIPLSTEIPYCSLRIGAEIISPICKLVKLGKTISLEFTAFGNLEEEILNDYLERIPMMKQSSNVR